MTTPADHPASAPVWSRPAEGTCPACGSADVVASVEIEGVPVHVGVLWPTPEEARACSRGDLRMAFCQRCGYFHNAAFDPSLVDYGLSYDNALHFSPVFQAFERDLAQRLLERYDLRGRDIVEIGSGNAHFLGLLCALGENRGVGFDPSHDPDHIDELARGRVRVHREYFGEQHAGVPADLLCCRHVLEHLADPRAFMAMLRRALDGRDTVLYFEVPNALLALRELSIWDLIYEHCGYYTAGTLARLFRVSGFEVLDVAEVYSGQFLGIEARVAEADPGAAVPPGELRRLAGDVAGFARHVADKRRYWEARLEGLRASRRRAVVWGAGAKTLSFVNFLDSAGALGAVVDINPRKQGTHLAGTGQEIVAPEALREDRPDVVLVMNPVYLDEIAASVRAMGLDAEIEAV